MAREKKILISADGAPYSVWQRRTRILCFLLIAWALFELAIGAGIIAVEWYANWRIVNIAPGVVMGGSTVFSGVFNFIVAAFGLYGAYNPKRITFFFWVILVDAVLTVWHVASNISLGLVDPSMVITLFISLVYLVCAWNVRGQTGYFDNHPKIEDE